MSGESYLQHVEEIAATTPHFCDECNVCALFHLILRIPGEWLLAGSIYAILALIKNIFEFGVNLG
jgi:hypothetical protein